VIFPHYHLVINIHSVSLYISKYIFYSTFILPDVLLLKPIWSIL